MFGRLTYEVSMENVEVLHQVAVLGVKIRSDKKFANVAYWLRLLKKPVDWRVSP